MTVLWLALAAGVGTLLFLLVRRHSYFSEVSALITAQQAEIGSYSAAQRSDDLGYYYNFWAIETSSVLTSQERSELDSPWTAPVAYGVQDHPVAIAQSGLVAVNRHISTRDARFLSRAVAAADCLCGLQQDDGSWRYSFPFIDLEPGWASCMAQGQAASLLLRVSQRTGETRYIACARKALEFMLTSVDDGGTMGAFADGTPFLEEYPGSDLSPNTLNGSIFGLWGLRDYGLLTGEARYLDLFQGLALGIAEHLSEYDTGDWTRYSLRADGSHLADDRYHRVHIVQARVMGEITGDVRWSHSARAWERYYYRRFGKNAMVVWFRDAKRRVGVKLRAGDRTGPGS